jgi:Carbamoyl-phosphate synthase L chain, ATP binding domain
MTPTVLVATTRRWFPTARMAMALANAGWTVEVVCPPGHLAGRASAVARTYPYQGLTPLASFARAIASSRPDLIVPCDDLSTWHLQNLHHRERQCGPARSPICALIERSLGAPESFPVVYARTAFMDLAREEGIRVPATEVVTTTGDLRKWIARMGFPTVLKANGTSGGDGVRIVHTLEQAERALQTLESPPLLARAAKRALVNNDQTLVWPSLLRRRSVVNAQAFVAGREATSTIACWQGTALAGLHFEVLNKQNPLGPSTVVRLMEDPEMSAATKKMVRRLNLSGLYGFDFMLEAQTGRPYLIEINPRTTQVGHLTLGPGRDLPAALYAAVSGQALRAAPKLTENDTITLFPQEWIWNPESAFLRSGYHDVPWGEPELVRACVRIRRKQWPWHSQQRWIETFSPVRLPRL